METRLTRRQSSVAVAVSGRLDMTSAARLEHELETLHAHGDRRVVLDLSRLDYLSSAGLRAILTAAKRLRESEGTLILVGIAGPVKEVFEMSGLSGVLESHPGEPELLEKRPDWA
jgi:anti-anti-sigma factor